MDKTFKNFNKIFNRKIVGITTIGEKGQIVVPAELRAAMKVAKGDKFVIISAHNAVILVKASQFEALAAQLTKRLASVRKLIKR